MRTMDPPTPMEDAPAPLYPPRPHTDAYNTRGRRDSSAAATMSVSPITMFKITTSAGNAIDQPVRPGDRFSGVLVVQLNRPISATQIVLELRGAERWSTNPKSAPRPERTQFFATELILWKAVRTGAANASTVLSDGLHVFNFACQIPNLNYPQNVSRPEFDISYQLEARLYAPRDMGGEHVASVTTKELFFTPLVVLPSSANPLIAEETLCFEKRGKLGKPVIEVRVGINTRQFIPGTRARIDMQIKELSSTTWTRVLVRLVERTRCRISTQMPFAQPLWSVDRDLAQAEVVRSSVYSYFINDDMIANKTSTETKNAAGETVTTDSVIFSIPPVAYGALNTEHLEFSHFVRLEVVLPGLMSSNRSVTMDIPVQMMTCEMHTAARFLSRRGSIPNIERKMDSDASSMLSGKSNSSGGHHSTHTARNATLSADTQASIMSSLPVRYCDIPPEQRPAPLLTFVNQLNVNPPASPVDDQARSMRNQTMSSMHSFDARTSSSGHSGDEYKEKYRTRPLPMAPSAGGAPPPLPAEPMPSSIPMAQQPPSAMSQQGPMPRAVNQTNIDVYQQSMRNPLVLAPYSPANSGSVVDVVRGESPIGGASSMVPDDSYMLASTKMRQHHQLTSRLHTPISPLYGGPHDDGLSDSEASYFREASRHSMERDAMNDAMFRAHQSSSINHYH